MSLIRSISQRATFQNRSKHLLAALMLLPLSSHAASVIWIGGAQTKQESFDFYLERLKERGFDSIEFASINTNPLSANHQKEITELRKRFSSIEPEKTLYVGYSIGGKFAARLSLDAAEAGRSPYGLFLLDPVGGQPPLQQNSTRFPDLMSVENEPVGRTVRSLIVSSELGTVPGLFGPPCVNPTYSSSFFKSIFSSSRTFSLANVGHLDFIDLATIPSIYRLSCRRGSSDSQSVRSETLKLLFEWLDQAASTPN
ncbi:hypothetical protein EBU99_12180 [bacterium]|nr:hypothetical protein [bacterium]